MPSMQHYSGPSVFPIGPWTHVILIVLSFGLVAFGQPTWCGSCGLAAAILGYALFWRSMWGLPTNWDRFWAGFAWFSLIQLFQLAWMLSHPYVYIYAIWSFFSFLFGVQFGLLCLLVRPANVISIWKNAAVAGVWALFEWSRLYFMSGFTWNPVGLALSGNLLAMQTAALAGVYGMSFWVIFVNLLGTRFWVLKRKAGPFILWSLAALFPYVYGYAHLVYYQHVVKNQGTPKELSTVLVQTAFPIEEMLPFKTIHEAIGYVQEEWKQIFKLLVKQQGKQIDLIIFPECTVPYGTYTPLFPYPAIAHAVKQVLGPEAAAKLPVPAEPYAEEVKQAAGPVQLVSNAYIAQALADIFNANVLIGLEDVEETESKSRSAFISAQYFTPGGAAASRYDKQVLLPMAEYIPSSFWKTIAKHYGILGSFTPGQGAKIFDCRGVPFGTSICYEETFGNLMRDNRLKGANMLVNLTSDIWYPHSALSQSHFDHARLRAVELGIPLVRACNTGITGAVDSFGRVLSILGSTPKSNMIWRILCLCRCPFFITQHFTRLLAIS